MRSDPDQELPSALHGHAEPIRDMGRHDFLATYDHRVRLICRGSSALVVAVSLAWVVYFALRGDWLLMFLDSGPLVVGALVMILSFGSHRLGAVLLLGWFVSRGVF